MRALLSRAKFAFVLQLPLAVDSGICSHTWLLGESSLISPSSSSLSSPSSGLGIRPRVGCPLPSLGEAVPIVLYCKHSAKHKRVASRIPCTRRSSHYARTTSSVTHSAGSGWPRHPKNMENFAPLLQTFGLNPKVVSTSMFWNVSPTRCGNKQLWSDKK